MRIQHIAVAAILLALSGCASKNAKPSIPQVVRVQVPQYVPLPESLTKPCSITRIKSRTVEAVVSAYNANIAALDDCDARMSEIRKLGK